MPTERGLAETYGVSRSIIREAVGRLKSDGLITSRQGTGAFVAEISGVAAFRFTPIDLTDAVEIRDVIELLMAVEAAASAHAAVRRSDAGLKAIEAKLLAMQDAIDRGEHGVEEDVAFHRAIVHASGNPFFEEMSQFLDGRVRNFIRKARSNTAQRSGLVQVVQKEHQAIYEAIAAQEPTAARQAAETHLMRAAERLAHYLPHPK